MGSKVISGFPAMPPQRSRAARLACCVAAIILRVSAAHAGVIGLAAAPEPLLGSKLSRPAAALQDEAACLLKANDTARLLTRKSACGKLNATISATGGLDLGCPASCRRQLQQVDGKCRNELVAGPEYGPTFQRVFTACNVTFKDPSTAPGSSAAASLASAAAASTPGIAPAVPVPAGGPAEAPAPDQGSTRRVSGATLAAVGAAAAVIGAGLLGMA